MTEVWRLGKNATPAERTPMAAPSNHATGHAADMRIIREPTVYLVGRQTVDPEELDRFLADHGVAWQTDTEVAAERLTETAGRLCYMSFARPRPGGNEAYLKHILEVGHGSVLEHAVWNLLIVGVSRSLTHELIRHRAGVSPSQLSQRYVDESVAEYVEPDCIAEDPELHGLWAETVAQSHQAYVKLVEKLMEKFKDEPDRTLRRKLARQAARSVLPNATETKIFLTANARAMRNFIELRASRHAEVEIRKLAVAVLRLMQQEAPHIFSDYQLTPLPDGTFEATTPHRKV
jgi:thymidylate synthase (FAD)